MFVQHLSTRKRPVNLTLNEVLVERARRYTDNLSATLESLLTEYVARQERELGLARTSRPALLPGLECAA
jgi:post-segregation antitoxin (ccd killing protein)